MTIRILPETEWYRLEDHPVLGGHHLPPTGSAVFFVAEDDDRIVGVQVVMTVLHLEPIWVDVERRGGTLAARLWKSARSWLSEHGVSMAFAFADRPDIAGYLERLGMKPTELRTFIYEESKSCLQSSLPPASRQ